MSKSDHFKNELLHSELFTNLEEDWEISEYCSRSILISSSGIEYAMMVAIGEGFEVLEKGEFKYGYEKVAKLWNNGSVIRSWLMELTEHAFSKDSKLEEIRGVMHSSGEGKWTVEMA